MKIENIKVFNIVDAMRGMRNPKNSWDRNDTSVTCDPSDGHVLTVSIGPNDLKLARALVHGGQPHRKFLRQIFVSMDIVAPVYIWRELDTYKVSTVANSCSIQHKGASRDFTADDFMLDDVNEDSRTIVSIVNKYRKLYEETKDYKYFRMMRQYMPMSYEYRETWTANYETLLSIVEWRRHHPLNEWHYICDMILDNCPGFRELCEKTDSGTTQG